MLLTYEKIIKIMDANAGYLSMDTPENLYKFLANLNNIDRGSIIEFCYSDLNYPILDKLNTLPADVLYGCTLNSNWTAGPNLTQIRPAAFNNCKMNAVDLSNAKFTELPDFAFTEAEIKKVILPEGLKKIGTRCFHNSNIEEIYIPSTVESIGKDSFTYCTRLQKVHLCRNSIVQSKLTMDVNDLERIRNEVVLY